MRPAKVIAREASTKQKRPRSTCRAHHHPRTRVSMSIVTHARNLSVVLLCICVLRGVILYDRRFTILLMPPFLLYYSQNTPGWFTQLPLVQYANQMKIHTENAYGAWPFRIFMVSAGLYLGANVGEVFGGPAAAPPAK